MSSLKKLRISLEQNLSVSFLPSPTSPTDLFAPPTRLHDVNLSDGTQSFTSANEEDALAGRLKRIWSERGDYTKLSVDSLLHPVPEGIVAEEAVDDRMGGEDVRELVGALMEQLSAARGELSSALDLLSILAPPTDPPTVDVDSLPLLPQTLTTVSALPPPIPEPNDADNSLPLATSLSSLHASATTFFAASEALLKTPSTSESKGQDPWPTLLHLHSTAAHKIIPLGAQRGATLSGKGETMSARTVGLFYACPEAGVAWRGAGIARVSDVLEEVRVQRASEVGGKERKGRRMQVRVSVAGEVGQGEWGAIEGDADVESVLRGRGKAVFAEELFGLITNEAQNDPVLKARFVLGKGSEGDQVVMAGYGWDVSIRMVPNSRPSTVDPSAAEDQGIVTILLPLLRLLFLQEYAQRRLTATSPTAPVGSRSLLATISVFLSHSYRLGRLREILKGIKDECVEKGMDAQLDFWGIRGERESFVRDRGDAVMRILNGDRELGGRVVFRVDKTRVFHVSFSLLLPQSPANGNAASMVAHQTLVLQAPGTGPLSVPSLEHLSLFVRQHVFGETDAEARDGSR